MLLIMTLLSNILGGQESCHTASTGNLCKGLHSLLLKFIKVYGEDQTTTAIDFFLATEEAARVVCDPLKDASALELLAKVKSITVLFESS